MPTGWNYRYGAYYYYVPRSAREHWDGKREFRLGATLPEAYATWAERLGAMERGDVTNISCLALAFEAEHLPTLAWKTQESYRIALKRIVAVFGPMAPEAIEQDHVREFYRALVREKSAAVARSTAGVMKTLMTFAAESPSVPSVRTNPLLGMRFKGSSGERRYVEDEEVDAALSVAPDSVVIRLVQAYIRLKLMTGVRRGDLLRLRLSDITEEGIRVRPSKTAKTTGVTQLIEWDEEKQLRTVIDEILSLPPRRIGDAPLFVTREGKPYVDERGEARAFSSLWQRFMARAVATTALERPFTERDLRAKVGSDEASAEAASHRLGHSGTAVTERHYRRAPRRLKPARIRGTGSNQGGGSGEVP